MAARKGGLGKGLDSLIPNKNNSNKNVANSVKEDNVDIATSTSSSDKKNASKTTNKKTTTKSSDKKDASKSADITAKKASAKTSTKTSSKKKTDAKAVKAEEAIQTEELIQTKELIQTDGPIQETNELMVKITKIEPNRDQPRKQFDEEALAELAESIKQVGLIQPLAVKNMGDYYMIVAGERRWRAAKLAGLKEIPVIVKNWSDQEIAEISLIENIQREDLNPIEEALAYERLINDFNMKQEELAEKVAKSRAAVANAMRLLKLCKPVQEMVSDGLLSAGHARTLVAVDDSAKQYELAQLIVEKRLSVRQTEELVKNLLEDNGSRKPRKTGVIEPSPIFKEMEEHMKQILGTKVSIKQKTAKKGCIEIEYYSHEELDHLLQLMATVDQNF